MNESAFDLHFAVLRDRENEEGVADTVLQWWQSIAENEEKGTRKSDKAARAELRRVRTPDEALLTEGFRNLWFALPSGRRDTRDMRAWGCVAAALAEVNSHDSARSLATAMGSESEAGSGKPRVSELRFQQLLRSDDLDDFLRRIRRAVRLLKRDVNVVSLADDILHWNREKGGDLAPRPDRRLAVRWANDYFTALATYEKSRSAS